jgi:hypothetical protein
MSSSESEQELSSRTRRLTRGSSQRIVSLIFVRIPLLSALVGAKTINFSYFTRDGDKRIGADILYTVTNCAFSKS